MSKTFEFQEQLQTLPMTNLNEAGINFLDWVEPLITKEQLRKFDFSKAQNKEIIAKRIMTTDFISLSPETATAKAGKLMNIDKTCVLVMEDSELLGIFTNNDLERIDKVMNHK